MSEDDQLIELITGTRRRRHWSTNEKLRIIEESLEPGETVSSVARRTVLLGTFSAANDAS